MRTSQLYKVLARSNRRAECDHERLSAEAIHGAVAGFRDAGSQLAMDDSVEELVGRRNEVIEHVCSRPHAGGEEGVSRETAVKVFEMLRRDPSTRDMFDDISTTSEDYDNEDTWSTTRRGHLMTSSAATLMRTVAIFACGWLANKALNAAMLGDIVLLGQMVTSGCGAPSSQEGGGSSFAERSMNETVLS